MAAIAAQPVYRLLGARDLSRSDDYLTEKMPGVNVDMLDGALAWRQHDGGHTDGPNVEHFIRWAAARWGNARSRLAGLRGMWRPTIRTRSPPTLRSNAAIPTPELAHQQLIAKTKQGTIDIYFEGDSITCRWGATDYPKFLAHWQKQFHGWNAANFGWGGDTTHNILWRLQNGEFDGVSPKIIVLQAGTNNLPWRGPPKARQLEMSSAGSKRSSPTSKKRPPARRSC